MSITKEKKNRQMGCNCKNTDGPQQYDVLREKEALSGVIVKYLAKTIGFLVGVALLPIIMLVIIWFMFDTIVLNKDIDLRTVINRFVKANEFFSKNDEDDDDEEDDDDDDEFEELTEDDVIMINVEDITEKSK